MKEIGGYFSLELRRGNEYHSNALSFNSARNALQVILLNKKYKKVWIPYYFCDSILQAFYISKTDFEFYHIEKNLYPILDFNVADDEALLIINYFGLKNELIKTLVSEYKNLIVDNSQAFFSYPFFNEETFYSCRKFFGVPDGSYLYTSSKINKEVYPIDLSEDKLSYLVGRIETGAEINYSDFRRNESLMQYRPTKQMSNLTKALMKNIDYEECAKIRTINFEHLHNFLKYKNELDLDSVIKTKGPFVYPFLINDEKLRQKLINNKIYIPTYWNNTLLLDKNYTEYYLAKYLLALPIDQRYGHAEMNKILEVVL